MANKGKFVLLLLVLRITSAPVQRKCLEASKPYYCEASNTCFGYEEHCSVSYGRPVSCYLDLKGHATIDEFCSANSGNISATLDEPQCAMACNARQLKENRSQVIHPNDGNESSTAATPAMAVSTDENVSGISLSKLVFGIILVFVIIGSIALPILAIVVYRRCLPECLKGKIRPISQKINKLLGPVPDPQDNQAGPEREDLLPNGARLREENERLQVENERLPEENERLQVENERLRVENERLPEENERLPEENERLRVENERLPEENERLPEENERLPEEIERLRVENERLREENERLPEENERLPEENERLRVENERLPEENERLRVENERLREENEGLREENERLREENERLPEENERLPEENEKLRVENERLREENERLREENEKLVKDSEDLVEKKKTLVEETAYIKGKKDQLTDDTKHLVKKKAQLTSSTETLMEKEERLTKHVQELDEKKERLTKHVQELDEKRERLTKDTEELDGKKERLTKDTKEIDEKKERLTKDTEELVEKKERLTKDIEELNEKKENLGQSTSKQKCQANKIIMEPKSLRKSPITEPGKLQKQRDQNNLVRRQEKVERTGDIIEEDRTNSPSDGGLSLQVVPKREGKQRQRCVSECLEEVTELSGPKRARSEEQINEVLSHNENSRANSSIEGAASSTMDSTVE